jgi:hypothetical protein
MQSAETKKTRINLEPIGLCPSSFATKSAFARLIRRCAVSTLRRFPFPLLAPDCF